MDAKDLGSDDGGNRERVEGIDKGLPDLHVAPPLAFIVETVDAGDVGALVVPPQQEEVLGILQLVAKQQQDGLERLLTTVDVVTKKEKVGLRGEAAHLKHADEVRVLAMHISDNLDGSVELKKRRLREEYLPGAMAVISAFLRQTLLVTLPA
jgi:hypothetical protein